MARVEILSGIERRRRWSSVQKLEIVRASLEPGAVIAEVARQFDVTRQQVCQWRSAFRAGSLSRMAAGVPTFVEVDLRDEPGELVGDGRQAMETVEIRLRGGRVLVVPTTIEGRRLRGLIRTVEAS